MNVLSCLGSLHGYSEKQYNSCHTQWKRLKRTRPHQEDRQVCEFAQKPNGHKAPYPTMAYLSLAIERASSVRDLQSAEINLPSVSCNINCSTILLWSPWQNVLLQYW